MADVSVVAFLGNKGWYENGRTRNGTFTRGSGLLESELSAPIRVDIRPTIRENPIAAIWSRPNLDLSLPDDNVRNLFEGCIGNEGSTDGHPWDGKLTFNSTDSVGLNVYLALLESLGALIERKA